MEANCLDGCATPHTTLLSLNPVLLLPTKATPMFYSVCKGSAILYKPISGSCINRNNIFKFSVITIPENFHRFAVKTFIYILMPCKIIIFIMIFLCIY